MVAGPIIVNFLKVNDGQPKLESDFPNKGARFRESGSRVGTYHGGSGLRIDAGGFGSGCDQGRKNAGWR